MFTHQNLFLFSHTENSFDTVLCLLLTKYLHLTFGDQAIIDLFHRIHQLLKVGGHLFLQAHPWASYRKDHRLFPVYTKNFKEIEWRPSRFPALLQKLGFQKVDEVTMDDPDEKTKKPVLIYVKL